MKELYTPYHESLPFAIELVSKAFKEVIKIIHRQMDFGINHEEYIILETIFLNPGIIQIDIAKKILMKRSYACKFLADLEEKGLIRKENAIRGKRQVIMKNYLTKEGEELYKNVREYFSKLISIKTTDQEFKKTKEITQILFERTKKIKKEFNLKF